MKHYFIILVMTVLVISITFSGLVQASFEKDGNVKELNFVFLHGLNGNSSALQLLEDSIVDQIPAYVINYQYDNPGINILTDTLNRSYPNDVDIETWANNIADSINQHFSSKNNLVLIGHSMGGKTALYAVSHNIGNLADKVAMVVTINSPIKSLINYYYTGGDTALNYWGAQKLISNRGALDSLVNHDSSLEGKWVNANKHWLAFISSESSPLSTQFDVSGIDPLPRDMDDTIVPISCQYSDGADVVYYGEYAHSDFTENNDVSNYIANQILTYVFGGNLKFSVFARGGSFEHKAGLLPGTDYWEDIVGGVLAGGGTLTHQNDAWFKLQVWEDIVGEKSVGSLRSSFQIIQKNSFPLLTGIQQADWASADDSEDCRVYLKTITAPRSSVQVDWSVYEAGLLPAGISRDHYEVEIDTGTQFTRIGQVTWETSDTSDMRLRILSQAQRPFRWFKAQWRVYYEENRNRQIIDTLSKNTLP